MISQEEKFLQILIIQKEKNQDTKFHQRQNNFWNFKIKDLGDLAINNQICDLKGI